MQNNSGDNESPWNSPHYYYY